MEEATEEAAASISRCAAAVLAMAEVVIDGNMVGPVTVTVIPVLVLPPPEDPVLEPDDPINANDKMISCDNTYFRRTRRIKLRCQKRYKKLHFLPVENLFAGHPYLLLLRCLSMSHRRLKTFPHEGHL